MNYRHQFHAGNFADVLKHVLVLALLDRLQLKDKGLLFLDTHAGRGGYDLDVASRGDSLARAPEWPEGWGRVDAAVAAGANLPKALQRYAQAVRDFAQRATANDALHPYPGSPSLAIAALRPQDRAVFCELQAEEATALRRTLRSPRNFRVERRDGYEAVRGCLPPLERRALVLIDPPYEQGDEAARVAEALQEGLRRLPAGTFAVWYPLTDRADAPAFLRMTAAPHFPPTWTAELTVAGPDAGLKMRGAGVMVVNPPWQLDADVVPAMAWLGEYLAQAPGGKGELRWLVAER